ncbi:protein of unknown function [Pseudodesulfovibrio profundus]|uniref:Uncharacterized protein n=1 Tax=Pseudodesulfovibrio profundus TaxID=57320 RepID=A0A2C8F784_9BACT|nr:protein of unknown function [Pseudodesulfovibrio profundus]
MEQSVHAETLFKDESSAHSMDYYLRKRGYREGATALGTFAA